MFSEKFLKSNKIEGVTDMPDFIRNGHVNGMRISFFRFMKFGPTLAGLKN